MKGNTFILLLAGGIVAFLYYQAQQTGSSTPWNSLTFFQPALKGMVSQ